MGKIVRKALPSLLQADDGATAIEYGLLSALIACVLVVSLSAVGSSLSQKLLQLESGMGASPASPGGGGSGGNGGNNGNGKGGNGNGNNGNGNGNGGPSGG